MICITIEKAHYMLTHLTERKNLLKKIKLTDKSESDLVLHCRHCMWKVEIQKWETINVS